MKLLTLGQLELRGSSFTRVKPLLLLTYLSLEGEQSREHLAELFWPGGSSRQRRNNLSKALSDLRAAVPDSVANTNTKVRSLVESDVAAFEQAFAAEDYKRAAQLYSGRFFEGHLSGWGNELEEWLFEQRERLAQAAQEAWLTLAEHSEPATALDSARTALRIAEPQIEMLRRFYALFVDRDKNLTKEILDLARGYGITLDITLDADPALELAPLATPSAQPLRAERLRTEPLHQGASQRLPTLARRLPLKGTSFVGRDVELSNIAYRLSQAPCRMLSLIGIGGVGKTRLAVQAGHELQAQFPAGVYFVALEALRSAELIPGAVATTLGIALTSQECSVQELAGAINAQDQDLLLILDNFEHLLGGASMLSNLLMNCAKLKLIVTSRERLGLEEEWLMPLAGLALPDDTQTIQDAQHFDAVQLFVQRATQAQMGFTLTPDMLEDVLALCHLLAGSPLALELAAAWTRLMSVSELRIEIERSLDSLTTQVKRTERHESLRSVFEYSWKLLSQKEQTLFKQLAVFRGGFSKEAAANVTGASVVDLVSLVDKSLLQVRSGRYDRHPLVSQYAQEKLEADPVSLKEMRERHLEYFSTLTDEAQPHLGGTEQKLWLNRLEKEHDNLRAALSYAEPEAALELAGTLRQFWSARGFWHEGRSWLEKALANTSAPTQTRITALRGAVYFAMSQGDYGVARRHASESLAIATVLDDKSKVLSSLNDLAGAAYYLGEVDKAADYMQRVLALSRELDDKKTLAWALNNLSILMVGQGQVSEAFKLQQESVQLAETFGSKREVVSALGSFAETAAMLEDYSSARDAHQKSLAIAQAIEHQDGIVFSLMGLGKLALDTERYDEAFDYWTRSLAMQQKLGSRNVPTTLADFVYLYARQERWLNCVVLLGALEGLIKDKKDDIAMTQRQTRLAEARAQTQAKLSEEDFARAAAKGAHMNLDEAIAYVLKSAESAVVHKT